MRKAHARAFLSLLHPNPTGTQLVQFVALRGGSPPNIFWHWNAACLALDQVLEANREGYSVFVGVNPRKTMAGGQRTNIVGTHAIPIDIDTNKTGVDVDAVVSLLTSWELPPSLVVSSGNGGHIYYFFYKQISL